MLLLYHLAYKSSPSVKLTVDKACGEECHDCEGHEEPKHHEGEDVGGEGGRDAKDEEQGRAVEQNPPATEPETRGDGDAVRRGAVVPVVPGVVWAVLS